VLLSLLNEEEKKFSSHLMEEEKFYREKTKDLECSKGEEKQNDLLSMSGGKKGSYTFFF